MKTKPILIIIASLLVVVCVFFIVKAKYFTKSDNGEITQFLKDFNYELKGGNTDSVLTYFQIPGDTKKLILFVKVLAGKTSINGKESPIFKLTLNIDSAKITFAGSGLAIAEVPVSFSSDSVPATASYITFKIRKTDGGKYKIVSIKNDEFLANYEAYIHRIRRRTISTQDYYAPITLASFKAAKELSTRYDSVLWFDHINNKTYYYVIKGKLNDKFYWADNRPADYKPTYKMGLVNPQLKEIIPTEYDLIHNVNGSINGLIEVEKNGEKGFYNLNGKLVVPVIYDQAFVLNDADNLALLCIGDDYYYLKNDTTCSEKIVGLKIADILPKIKTYGDSYTMSDKSSKDLMEDNVFYSSTTLVIPPSYLVEMRLLPQFMNFQNPLRKLSSDDEGDGDGSLTVKIKFDGEKDADGDWFKTAFYSLYDDYLGARSGLYEGKKVLMIDKKQNRIFGFDASSYFGNGEGGGSLSGLCNENSLRAINDTLFEFRTTSSFTQQLLGENHMLEEGPYYHYLHLQNGKLVALPNNRLFACTRYIKLDDSYLQGCYVIDKQSIDHVTPELLQYMKNEIYASYGYKFKSQAWKDVFMGLESDGKNDNVDDSLTTIDKYNINWINQKLNALKSKKLAAN